MICFSTDFLLIVAENIYHHCDEHFSDDCPRMRPAHNILKIPSYSKDSAKAQKKYFELSKVRSKGGLRTNISTAS